MTHAETIKDQEEITMVIKSIAKLRGMHPVSSKTMWAYALLITAASIGDSEHWRQFVREALQEVIANMPPSEIEV